MTIFDTKTQETKQELNQLGGWGQIKSVRSLLGSNRHFLVKDRRETVIIAFKSKKDWDFSIHRVMQHVYGCAMTHGQDTIAQSVKMSLMLKESLEVGTLQVFSLEKDELISGAG